METRPVMVYLVSVSMYVLVYQFQLQSRLTQKTVSFEISPGRNKFDFS